jgi:hypothetical protein
MEEHPEREVNPHEKNNSKLEPLGREVGSQEKIKGK